MKKLYKALSLIMALVIAFCLPVTASADGTTIDYGKTASLELYKYDMCPLAWFLGDDQFYNL